MSQTERLSFVAPDAAPVPHPEPPAAPQLTLELALPQEDAARLARLPELARRHDPRGGRTVPRGIVWHDSPDGVLAADGLALAEHQDGRATLWRLERLVPAAGALWVPGVPAPVVAEAPDPDGLGHRLPPLLLPVAGFDGHARAYRYEGPHGCMSAVLLQGVLRAVAGEHPACRLMLSGSSDGVAALALALSDKLRLTVPPAAFAAEALAVARVPPPPRHLGAPALPPGIAIGDAFAFVVAHLADVILHFAPLAAEGVSPEPVHQMRVALRRLKSALSLFKKAVGCPELEEARTELRTLAQVLGPARDWDVFTSGTGQAVAQAFGEDMAVRRLVASAHRRRGACYVALRAYLESPAFRRLGLVLALLAATRPWERPLKQPLEPHAWQPAPAEAAQLPPAGPALDLGAYAARALHRRLRDVLAPGADISTLPPEALHEIRLNGKRLRYAAEFFSPLFPRRETRRFIRRVAALQERLGHLNDGAVAAGLLEELGSPRGYAAGIVRGFVAAGSVGARADIVRSWKKLRRQDGFWE